MERIRVSIDDRPARQIQGSVSELNIDSEFIGADLLLTGLDSERISSNLKIMNCIESVGSKNGKLVWKKIHDPRLFLQKPKRFPGKCEGCHFTKSETVGCVILQDYYKRLHPDLTQDAV